jgi:hypothetical protein
MAGSEEGASSVPQLHVPVREVDKMPPTLVMIPMIKGEMREWPPLGPFRSPDQSHPRFLWGLISFASVARNTRADDIFPRHLPAAITGHYMIEVQFPPFEEVAAILTGVLVALENVVPGELHLFLRHAVVEVQDNHLWETDAGPNGHDHFRLRLLLRKSRPTVEIMGPKAVAVRVDDLSMALAKERKSTFSSANVNRLP